MVSKATACRWILNAVACLKPEKGEVKRSHFPLANTTPPKLTCSAVLPGSRMEDNPHHPGLLGPRKLWEGKRHLQDWEDGSVIEMPS